ncbi:MAG: hypothetical protein HXY48_05800 [Ignavibacteriaceae bacterium]|nr:hypothetical protein [Ignavibacteriaceae bacterium]
MKTQKTLLVLSVIISFMLLIIISACGDKNDSAEDRGQQLQQEEKELIESGKQGVKDLTGKVDFLTPADIESVSGLKGIKLVEKGSLQGAGGSLNFALNDKMYAMFVIADMGVFNEWKTMEGYAVDKIPNIGDEAYSAPGGKTQFVVFFREGNKVGSVSSFLDTDTLEPFLTIEQLSQLARIVVSRF